MGWVSDNAAKVARRRRRRRTAATLTVVGLLLAGTFVYAAAYVEGWVGRTGPALAQSCSAPTLPPAARAVAADVIVNVYNATDRGGLAASTASGLRGRGFKVATVSNDPLHSVVPGPAMIRYGVTGTKAARVLAHQVVGARLLRDGRNDSSVDLVLGQRFTALAVPAKAAPAKTKPSQTVRGKPGKSTPVPAASTGC